jgi:hypothetical protein
MRPVTAQEVVVDVQVLPSGVDVTVYSVIGLPPVLAGAVHETTERRLPKELAVTEVGAPGTVAGTAEAEDVDGSEVPEAFVAVTLNVYEVPLVRPVTTQVVSPVVRHVLPSGVETTVYREITAPLLAGAVHDTVDWVDSSDVAETPVGAPGTVDGVAEFDATEAALVPALFVAVTVNVYAVPFVRPDTVQVVAPVVVHVFDPGVDVTV